MLHETGDNYSHIDTVHTITFLGWYLLTEIWKWQNSDYCRISFSYVWKFEILSAINNPCQKKKMLYDCQLDN